MLENCRQTKFDATKVTNGFQGAISNKIQQFKAYPQSKIFILIFFAIFFLKMDCVLTRKEKKRGCTGEIFFRNSLCQILH